MFNPHPQPFSLPGRRESTSLSLEGRGIEGEGGEYALRTRNRKYAGIHSHFRRLSPRNPMTTLCLALSLAAVSPNEHDSITLTAGVARVDITPPLELKASLGGYGDRMNKPATGIHDRVWAKALVIRQGSKRFALVTADILGFPPGFKDTVVHGLAVEGWKPEQVMLLASHSHTSIDFSAINPKNTFGIPQIGVFNKALYDRTLKLFTQRSEERRVGKECR